MKIHPNRIIGQRTGGKKGPLLIIFAEIHGNEPAGSIAINKLFHAIDNEYKKKPHFDFRGKIIAIRGNIKAREKGLRFIDKDLNRSWLPEKITHIKNTTDIQQLDAEDQEIKEILHVVEKSIAEYQPEKTVILDLHTTTAHGGIFTIPAKMAESRRLGLAMCAPVLHGFLEGLRGTSLHYFTKENFGIDITPVCFEAGQHSSEDSPKHAVSAIIKCFTAMGGFYSEDIENKHNELLEDKSSDLPLEANLVYVHSITDKDEFRMKENPRYNNFDPIEQGEHLAYDKDGEIYAPYGGLILMPLYQTQGSDGFFIIQEIEARSQKKKLLIDNVLIL